MPLFTSDTSRSLMQQRVSDSCYDSQVESDFPHFHDVLLHVGEDTDIDRR
jgi:hypothetical protein